MNICDPNTRETEAVQPRVWPGMHDMTLKGPKQMDPFGGSTLSSKALSS